MNNLISRRLSSVKVFLNSVITNRRIACLKKEQMLAEKESRRLEKENKQFFTEL